MPGLPSRRDLLLGAMALPLCGLAGGRARASECTNFVPAWEHAAPDPGWDRHARLAASYPGAAGPAPVILYDARQFQSFDAETGAPWTAAPVSFPAGAVVEQVTSFGGDAFATGSLNGAIYVAKIPGGTGTAPLLVNDFLLGKAGSGRALTTFDETRLLVLGVTGANSHFMAPTRYSDAVCSWFLYPDAYAEPLAGCASPLDGHVVVIARFGAKVIAMPYTANLTVMSGQTAFQAPASAERAQTTWHGDRCWFTYPRDDGYDFGQVGDLKHPDTAAFRFRQTGLADPRFAHTLAVVGVGDPAEPMLVVATGAGIDLYRPGGGSMPGFGQQCVTVTGADPALIRSVTGIDGRLFVSGGDGTRFFVRRMEEAALQPAPDDSGGAVLWAD